MALSFKDAAEIAWAAFLDEVGEPLVPDWRTFGWAATNVVPYPRSAAHTYPFLQIVFVDPMLYPNWDVARVWVDKQTGHCNVWVNEKYEPLTPEQQQEYQTVVERAVREVSNRNSSR